MATLNCEIVTAERIVFSGDVDMVVAPGIEGELGVLPRHAPLLTALQVGGLRIKQGREEILMAVSGGFMEVLPNKVIILADAAERAEEIDVARADEARRRAESRLAQQANEVDTARAEAALRRSLMRLKIAEQVRERQRR
ncbi:MAG: F0F1 ATP synthase subunit epsilon [Chloroflexi bacterium]|nr:F0F1 ATP synthase subunit epsilon [Chloroflexota bacterium]